MIYYNENNPYAAQWLRNLIDAGVIGKGKIDERSIRDVRGGDLKGFKQCHFFAGIGGWSYALRLAGWPDDREVWTGSCPCQPFSVAGKQKETDDERHLWPEFRRLINSNQKPTVILGEQVASKAGRKWLSGVRSDLEIMGYGFGAADLCAAGVGSPNIRQRLWWMGLAVGQRLQRLTGPIDGGSEPGWDHQEQSGSITTPGSVDGVADTGEQQRDRRRAGKEVSQSEKKQRSSGLRYATQGDPTAGQIKNFWRDADWLLCRDGKWRRVEPGTSPLANGIPADLGSMRPGEISPHRQTENERGELVGLPPWRKGMLEGYGNAINPYTAKDFIIACAEATE